MATIEKLWVSLAGNTRADVSPSFNGNASWFDLMMHAIGLTNSHIYWDYEYVNELENEHHYCMAILCRGDVEELTIFLDELMQMMSNEMLRHTLWNMQARDMTTNNGMTWVDHTLPFDASLRRYGWFLVLPNVITSSIRGLRHELPLKGTNNESD
jgi:hypothetical protein